MKTLEIESGFTVMISKRDFEFLSKLKASKKKKFKRDSFSDRATMIANRLVQNHLLNRDEDYFYLLPYYEKKEKTMKLTESKRRSLKVINETLRKEHKFDIKLDESIPARTLKKIKADVQKELKDISYSKSPQTNSEYSQCILVLEAVDLLLGKEEKELNFNDGKKVSVFEQIDYLEKMYSKLMESALSKGDVVDYLGHEAQVVNVDGKDAYVKIKGQSGTQNVNLSQLKPLKSKGNASPKGKTSISKGDVVDYLGHEAQVVNVDGKDAYIKIKGQSGTQNVNLSQLKPMTNESAKKKMSVFEKSIMIREKIEELRNRAYMESKEDEIRMMLSEDAQKAEVIMAAKNLLDTVQGFQTKIGDLMNKNLDPFIERVRSVYGSDTADKVYSNVDESLMTLLGQVKDAKEVFGDVVGILSGDEEAELGDDLGKDDEETLPDLESDDKGLDLDDGESDDEESDDEFDLDLDDISDNEETFKRKEE